MTFDEILAQILELLRREGGGTYRGIKRRFALDDDYLEDLKGEIIKAKRLAVDEDGEVLVWIGASSVTSSASQISSSPPPAFISQKIEAGRQTFDSPRPEAERRQLTVMF